MRECELFERRSFDFDNSATTHQVKLDLSRSYPTTRHQSWPVNRPSAVTGRPRSTLASSVSDSPDQLGQGERCSTGPFQGDEPPQCSLQLHQATPLRLPINLVPTCLLHSTPHRPGWRTLLDWLQDLMNQRASLPQVRYFQDLLSSPTLGHPAMQLQHLATPSTPV